MQQLSPKPKTKKRIPFKDEPNTKKHYHFIYSSAISPHPQKIDKGGQDAVFVSQNVLAVADGVGSWKDFGIDPGIYSKKLIENISNLLQDQEKRNYYIDNPQKLACASVNLNNAQGSSTLSIITLHPKTGILRTYHIGDSIYGIFHQSGEQILGLEQQYIFNHPYQVGSNFINRQSNQQMEFCKPDLGIYNQFHFSEIRDSHVVLASDGIWDNLFPHEIHNVIKESSSLKYKQNIEPVNQVSLHYAVDKMMEMARSKYVIQNYESPFYIKGRDMGLNVGKFAKVDDLSLIVAKVVEKNQ